MAIFSNDILHKQHNNQAGILYFDFSIVLQVTNAELLFVATVGVAIVVVVITVMVIFVILFDALFWCVVGLTDMQQNTRNI